MLTPVRKSEWIGEPNIRLLTILTTEVARFPHLAPRRRLANEEHPLRPYEDGTISEPPQTKSALRSGL